jgi:sigma-E factor negative regulatory protein RseC
MTDPQGTIVEIIRDGRGTRAIVEVEAAAVCARCASGRGCGAGLFAGRQGLRRLELGIAANPGLEEGAVVALELAPASVLRAALIVYGLPLAGAAVGAALAYALMLGDAGAAALALVGLCAGALAGRQRLASESCLARFTPAIARVVRNP